MPHRRYPRELSPIEKRMTREVIAECERIEREKQREQFPLEQEGRFERRMVDRAMEMRSKDREAIRSEEHAAGH